MIILKYGAEKMIPVCGTHIIRYEVSNDWVWFFEDGKESEGVGFASVHEADCFEQTLLEWNADLDVEGFRDNWEHLIREY